MSRPEKQPISKVREGLQILATLFIVGAFVVWGLNGMLGDTFEDTEIERNLHVQLWCEGFGVGITDAVTRQGYQPPYQNDWERLLSQCVNGEIYLNPYNIQFGSSPPGGQETLYTDLIPVTSPTQENCIPTMLRTC